MQLNLTFLDQPDPSAGRPRAAQPTAWRQLDEAARVAALERLTRLIARVLAAKLAKAADNE